MSLKKTIKSLLSRLRGDLPVEAYVKRGMKVGKNLRIQQGVRMDISHCWLISIGDNVSLAPGVRLIAHDGSTNRRRIPDLNVKIGLITIGDNVFVGAGSIILRGVTIGDNVIIGAGSVVSRDIPSNSVAAGNPCKVIGTYEDFLERNRSIYSTHPYFGGATSVTADSPMEKKEEQVRILKENGRIGFVGHGPK